MLAAWLFLLMEKNRRTMYIFLTILGLMYLVVGAVYLCPIEKQNILRGLVNLGVGLIFVVVARIERRITKNGGQSVQEKNNVIGIELTLGEAILFTIAGLLFIVESYVFRHEVLVKIAYILGGILFVHMSLWKWWGPKAERKYRQTHGIES